MATLHGSTCLVHWNIIMTHALIELLSRESRKLEQAGLSKKERLVETDSWRDGGSEMVHVIDFTSDDYLGLQGLKAIHDSASAALDLYGPGVFSTRMQSGTRSIHRELEKEVATFLGMPAALVYTSRYQACLGLFEPLFDQRDYIFCDAVVHPSIADGARLSGARVHSFANHDLDDLEDKLKRSRGARFRAIVTDGVSPLDGVVANLPGICRLAETYDALTIVDDSMGLGVLGTTGRGTAEHHGVTNRVDILIGSFEAALGGSTGGFISAHHDIVDWLRQKSIPYIFSGAMPPPAAGSAKGVLKLLERDQQPLEDLRKRQMQLRSALANLGYRVYGGEHPLLAVDVMESITLQKMINQLFDLGIFAYGLCYPVVPEGEARIRFQVSANHTEAQLEQTITALESVGRDLSVI